MAQLRASYGFIEHNFYLVRRHCGWEVVWLAHSISNALAIPFIVLQATLLLPGVHYPVTVLPRWMQALAWFSPAIHVLEDVREALLAGRATTELWGHI